MGRRGETYGQGSRREHAAPAPRYLGLRPVVAESFALRADALAEPRQFRNRVSESDLGASGRGKQETADSLNLRRVVRFGGRGRKRR